MSQTDCCCIHDYVSTSAVEIKVIQISALLSSMNEQEQM